MFVRRDEHGAIVAVSREATEDFPESIDGGHPHLIAFIKDAVIAGASPLQQSDLDTVRVLEDLIEVLVAKEVVRFTDLPEPAQEKLLRRRALRDVSSNGLSLVDDGDGII
jgi:hypothetical protein